MRAGVVFVFGLALTSAGIALAQQASPQGAARQRPAGYLTADTTPEASLIIPPPPIPGTPGDDWDRTLFKQTRALKGTPRWALAQNDNLLSAPALLNSFSCSVGAKLTPENAPAIVRIIGRTIVDADRGSRTAKAVFKRPRPYLRDEGDICIEKTPGLAESPDYPSGHVTIGWSLGLALAQAAPDRASPILVRARAFGESRAVCGVHSASAVEAGRDTAATVVAAQNSTPAFRADIEQARAEITAARADPANRLDPAVCAAEAALTAKSAYPN